MTTRQSQPEAENAQAQEIQLLRQNLADQKAQAAAMAEILDVISQSRGDNTPVFEAILENAQALCDAPMAALALATPGDAFQTLAAHRNISGHAVEMFHNREMLLDGDVSYAAKSILDGKLIALADMGQSDLYHAGSPVVRSMVDEVGIRSVLFVPLMKGDSAIGCITLFRYEVVPFEDHVIELVQTFAAHALIAIENKRQFQELQTRLERERGMAEVLEVISQSRDDETPVFDLILRKSAELCGAHAAALALGQEGGAHQTMAASYGVEAETVALYDRGDVSMNPDVSIAAKAILTGQVIHIEDMKTTQGYLQVVSHFLSVVDDTGIRTNLFVPLITKDGGIGVLILFRKEVRPYSDDEITLVETFAAQAVIAIENVRQFRELQTRLEREAATSEILSVISQSREDEGQVFDIILQNAATLCSADQSALILADENRTSFRLAANWGHTRTAFDVGRKWPFDSMLTAGVVIRTAEVLHIPDYKETERYKSGDPEAIQMVENEGIRTRLVVPLMRNGIAIGAIALSRREVRSFEPSEIQLIETFAAQAVIAIENVRQFRELQVRLQREEATREILQVISQSRDDDQPVFEAILSRAAKLCGAPMAGLNIVNEPRTSMSMVAHWGENLRHLAVNETVWQLDSDLATVEPIHSKKNASGRGLERHRSLPRW